MANEVQKEPTMEEILASIRKIISDDGAEVTNPAETQLRPTSNDTDVEMPDQDDFDDLTYDDAEASADVFESGKDKSLVFEDDTGAALVAEFNDDQDDSDLSSIEDLLGEPETDIIDDVAVSFSEPEPEPQPSFVEEVAPAVPEYIEATPPQEDRMSAPHASHTSPLTDDRTADAAAGALGKLMASMDISSDNSLEGLVRAMLQPMLKEWLDENLSGIVEAKVEAEVARIARMAR